MQVFLLPLLLATSAGASKTKFGYISIYLVILIIKIGMHKFHVGAF